MKLYHTICSSMVIAAAALGVLSSGTAAGCSVTNFGAVSGNRSSDAKANTKALNAALATCDLVRVPEGAFKIVPIDSIPSHKILYLEAGASLVGSEVWEDYGVTHFLPRMGNDMQLRPLISATNATNVTITGQNGTIDGNGWFAWPAANWSSPDCGMRKKCAGGVFFGNTSQKLRPPHVMTFVYSSDVTVSNVTITNPAFWGLQHFFCNRSVHSHVTILAPRWTRQISGFMPWSVLDYIVEDSYVHVGDDALAIMSGNNEWGRLWPSRGLVFRRLFVRGRSVAIGSADFGNVTDVLFDECTIGDDEGSSPWAFKIKMHVNHPSHVGNITIRNTKFGRIASNTWQDPGNDGGTALPFGMNYAGVPIDRSKGQPYISNFSFINVTANQTRVAGSFDGASANSIRGLHFKNCDFRATTTKPWVLHNVDVASCSSVNTSPSFPSLSWEP